MESTFKIGDVVRLKSGGPRMVISSNIDEDGEHEVHWFERKEKSAAALGGNLIMSTEHEYEGKPQVGWIPAPCMEKVTP